MHVGRIVDGTGPISSLQFSEPGVMPISVSKVLPLEHARFAVAGPLKNAPHRTVVGKDLRAELLKPKFTKRKVGAKAHRSRGDSAAPEVSEQRDLSHRAPV